MFQASEKAGILLALCGLFLIGATSLGFSTSQYAMNLIGQIAAFALLALSLDLLWGFCGILSLGHGLFFAIGGYLVAMHLVKVTFDATGTPPDFMLFMGWDSLPFYYFQLDSIAYLIVAIAAVTTVVSFVFGYVSFRSRVTGVYFAIITQALVYMVMLYMFRNDSGFGGNNGMTGFKEIFGMSASDSTTAAFLCGGSLATLGLCLYGCKKLVDSPIGQFMLAVREDESRLRFLGVNTVHIKLIAWCISAILAAMAGFLYVPQVGIVNPTILSPELSIEIAAWVALGGRGSLLGPILGAVVISGLKFILTGLAPDLWPFILAILIICVVIWSPNGLADTSSHLASFYRRLGSLSSIKGRSQP